MSDQISLPISNPELARLLDLARLPEAPKIALHWFDAGFDSAERWIAPGPPPKDYRAGCPDVVCGFYLGIADGCVIMGHSAYVREGKLTSYRHIWNIPVSLVIKVELLQVVEPDGPSI